MQTNFSLAQLAVDRNREAEKIIRSCVHCGFCLATCPPYTLLGDERDSPRGRIYQTKTLLEEDRAVTEGFVQHIDRCLSCLSCMTTCPSGVNYMHLVDEARTHIEESGIRPRQERWLRSGLATLLTRPGLFRTALVLGSVFAPLARPFASGRFRAMLDLMPGQLSPKSWANDAGTHPARSPAEPVRQAKGRVVLLKGCAQQVLAPETNEATIRLLNRLGYSVEIVAEETCCGSLELHMGKEEAAREKARQNVLAWSGELKKGDLKGVIVTASGCGTTVKDYGHLLRNDSSLCVMAEQISSLAKDITEFLVGEEVALAALSQGARESAFDPLRSSLGPVACHLPCSMQHGQKITWQPQKLMRAVGLEVREPAEGHLCCGSAGTYNIMQPELAGKLRDRKVSALENTGAVAVISGNVGCIAQIGGGTERPVLHTVELLDWMTGGPAPDSLSVLRER